MSLSKYVLTTFSKVHFLAVIANKLNGRNDNISSKCLVTVLYLKKQEGVLNLLLLRFFVITFKLALVNFQTTYQMKNHRKKKGNVQLIELDSRGISDKKYLLQLECKYVNKLCCRQHCLEDT